MTNNVFGGTLNLVPLQLQATYGLGLVHRMLPRPNRSDFVTCRKIINQRVTINFIVCQIA